MSTLNVYVPPSYQNKPQLYITDVLLPVLVQWKDQLVITYINLRGWRMCGAFLHPQFYHVHITSKNKNVKMEDIESHLQSYTSFSIKIVPKDHPHIVWRSTVLTQNMHQLEELVPHHSPDGPEIKFMMRDCARNDWVAGCKRLWSVQRRGCPYTIAASACEGNAINVFEWIVKKESNFYMTLDPCIEYGSIDILKFNVQKLKEIDLYLFLDSAKRHQLECFEFLIPFFTADWCFCTPEIICSLLQASIPPNYAERPRDPLFQNPSRTLLKFLQHVANLKIDALPVVFSRSVLKWTCLNSQEWIFSRFHQCEELVDHLQCYLSTLATLATTSPQSRLMAFLDKTLPKYVMEFKPWKQSVETQLLSMLPSDLFNICMSYVWLY